MNPNNMELMQNKQEEELVIDLWELLAVIWKNLLLIVEAGLILGALVFIASTLFMPKQYQSSTEVYILNKQNESSANVTYSDLQTGSYLTKDYRELITSLPVMEKVTAQLSLDMAPEKLAEHISVSTPADTRIIKISATHKDPYMANMIADAVRVAASAQIAAVMDIEAVNVVQKADYPRSEVSPPRLKYTFLGCILGSVLAVGVLFLIYLLDDSIKTIDDVEKYLGVSVLGSIPMLKEEEAAKKHGKRKHSHKKATAASADKEQE